MTKRILFAGLVGLTLLISQGCSTVSSIRHRIALNYYDPLTKERSRDSEGNEIPPFNVLSEGLEEYLRGVYIIDKRDFFNPGLKAHAHTQDINSRLECTICLPEEFGDEDAVHEAVHVRHQALDNNGSDFSNLWNETAEIVYGEVAKIFTIQGAPFGSYWADANLFDEDEPRHGCLGSYGGTFIREDVATFVETIYKPTPEEVLEHYSEEIEIKKLEKELSKLRNESSDFELISPLQSKLVDLYGIVARKEYLPIPGLYLADPSDARYQAKIDLLLKYRFLIKEEHRLLTERVGCLREIFE